MGYYAGIGSRQAPPDVLELAEVAATKLDEAGWTLRSGHAPGMDQAFEAGAGDNAEVYLPWPSFEKSEPLQARHIYGEPTARALEIAAEFHPAWERLSQGARKLHARNSHQVFGPDCSSPVSFVLCWTPDGKDSGGTAQALRIARANGISITNLGLEAKRNLVERWLANTP